MGGEVTCEPYGFITTDPNPEVGAIHTKVTQASLPNAGEHVCHGGARWSEPCSLQRTLPPGSLHIVAGRNVGRGVRARCLELKFRRRSMDKASARRAMEAYVAAFNARDFVALGAVLAEDASLADWEVSATGKSAMLETTAKIASSAKLRITIDRIILDIPHAAADLQIAVNKASVLAVLDSFRVNEDGQSKPVRAYEGPKGQL